MGGNRKQGKVIARPRLTSVVARAREQQRGAPVEELEEVAPGEAGEESRAGLFYRVKWSDQEERTWEPVENIAEDLVRDFEDSWWNAARSGDPEELQKMMEKGRNVLPLAIDREGRSALHYATGKGSEDCIRALLEAGADVNRQDKDGYSPLHIASGYLQSGAVRELLRWGADPELEDEEGKTPMGLVESLREKVQGTMLGMTQRQGLDEVARALDEAVFEEVPARKIVSERLPEGQNGDPQECEFLVDFFDNRQPEWVPESRVADDLVDDFRAGKERAVAARILDERGGNGRRREFLIEWEDDEQPTWEPRANVPDSLLHAFRTRSPSDGSISTKTKVAVDG